jgi:hypothetical protein
MIENRKNLFLVCIFLIISLFFVSIILECGEKLIDDFEHGMYWWAISAEIKLISPGCPESPEKALYASFSTPRGVGVIRRNADFKLWKDCDYVSFYLKGDGSDRKAYFYLHDDNGPQYHEFSLKDTNWHKVVLYFKNFISEKESRNIGGINLDKLTAQIDIYADKDSSFTIDHLQIGSSKDVNKGTVLKYDELKFDQIENPIIVIPKVKTPPIIDGRMEESIWKEATEVSQFFNIFGERSKIQTKVLLAYDNSNIYFLFICDEPYIDYLKANAQKRDDPVYLDDCIEIFIQPYSEKELEKKYFHLITNSNGIKYDEIGMGGVNWNPQWEVKTSLSNFSWIAEIAVPFSSLGSTPQIGDVWRLNLCRERWVNPELSSWACTKGGFHKPESFGYLIFGNETSPSISKLDLGEKFCLGSNFVNFNFKNRDLSKNLSVKIDIEDTLTKSLVYTEKFNFDPGEEKKISVKYMINKRGENSLKIKIYEADKNFILYQSDKYSFVIPPLIAVNLDRTDRYYYETDEKLNLIIKLTPEPTMELKKLQLRAFLTDKSNNKIEEKILTSLSSNEINLDFNLSLLPLGEYVVNSVLLNNEGKEIFKVTENFQKISTPLVRIDEKGRVFIEGKPFFPLVAWVRPINFVVRPEDLTKEIAEKTLSEVKNAGFNAVEAVAVRYYISHPEYYRTFLEVARQKGLKVVGELWGNGELLDNFKGDKNVIAWYISDEPEFKAVPRENIINTHRFMKEKDPYKRPTILSNAILDGIYRYQGITDIHSTHPYPVPFQPLDVLYHQVKKIVELNKDKKISPWAIIQLHDLSRYGFKGGRAPTPEEVRCLVYLAITAGAKGLMYYSYYDPNGGWDKNVTFWNIPENYPEINEELKKIHFEIQKLSPIILSEDSKELIILKPDNLRIYFLQKKLNNKLYLILVNSEPKEVEITLNFPEIKIKEVKEFFSQKLIKNDMSAFKDKLNSYEARVYQISY